MKLCGGRNKIIKLFEDKNIDHDNFPLNAESELQDMNQMNMNQKHLNQKRSKIT